MELLDHLARAVPELVRAVREFVTGDDALAATRALVGEVDALYARVTRIDEGMLENQRPRDAGANAVDRCCRIEL